MGYYVGQSIISCPCHEQVLRDLRERVILSCHNVELDAEGPRPARREPIPDAVKQEALRFLDCAVRTFGLPVVDFGPTVDGNNRAVPLDDGEVSPPGYYVRLAMGCRQAVVRLPAPGGVWLGNIRVTFTVYRGNATESAPPMSIPNPKAYVSWCEVACARVRDWLYTRDQQPEIPKIITEGSST